MPKFFYTPTPGSGCQMVVRIVFLEIVMYFFPPLCCHQTIARYPAVRSVYFVHNKPDCECSAVAPPGNEIPVQFLLISPCGFAAIKIFSCRHLLIRVRVPPYIPSAPNGL